MGRIQQNETLVKIDISFLEYLEDYVYEEIEHLSENNTDKKSVILVACSAGYYLNQVSFLSEFINITTNNYQEIVAQISSHLIDLSDNINISPYGLLYNFIQIQMYFNKSKSYIVIPLYDQIKTQIGINKNSNLLDHMYKKYNLDVNALTRSAI